VAGNRTGIRGSVRARKAGADELEEHKTRLHSEIDGTPADTPRLHPNVAEIYRKKVGSLQDALADPATKTEAIVVSQTTMEARINPPWLRSGLWPAAHLLAAASPSGRVARASGR
jgi:hypothetical protein